ncbi:hypothetical protein QQF64_003322 [Cirrhinus molitorella]|uniref:Uncharacterized protein n=1 Tax=Cirrhinus molitorella TaxID=172907 RepID=A0ABR3MKZ5_9TELE
MSSPHFKRCESQTSEDGQPCFCTSEPAVLSVMSPQQKPWTLPGHAQPPTDIFSHARRRSRGRTLEWSGRDSPAAAAAAAHMGVCFPHAAPLRAREGGETGNREGERERERLKKEQAQRNESRERPSRSFSLVCG